MPSRNDKETKEEFDVVLSAETVSEQVARRLRQRKQRFEGALNQFGFAFAYRGDAIVEGPTTAKDETPNKVFLVTVPLRLHVELNVKHVGFWPLAVPWPGPPVAHYRTKALVTFRMCFGFPESSPPEMSAENVSPADVTLVERDPSGMLAWLAMFPPFQTFIEDRVRDELAKKFNEFLAKIRREGLHLFPAGG